jgi:hypothetical protein
LVLLVLCLAAGVRHAWVIAFGGAVLVLALGEALGIIPSQEAAERNERPPSILPDPGPPKKD